MASAHKNSNIIVINDRRYDAHTGALLDHDGQTPAADKHDAVTREPASQAQIHHGHRGQAAHERARHVKAHPQKPAKTLMRQAVKRPEADFRRRIKVQARLDGSAKPGASKIIARSSDRQPDTRRLQSSQAKRGKGYLISHFSPDLFSVESYTPAITYGSAPLKHAAVHEPIRPAPDKRPKTTDELLEYAVQRAAGPAEPSQQAHRRRRKLVGRRVHTH